MLHTAGQKEKGLMKRKVIQDQDTMNRIRFLANFSQIAGNGRAFDVYYLSVTTFVTFHTTGDDRFRQRDS